jgi:hypothetical protein
MHFRPGITLLFILLSFGASQASPCSLIKSQPDAWVRKKVDALVLTARQLFDDEEKSAPYNRVLAEISNTIRQCRLAEDQDLAGRYRQFLEYIDEASLDRRPDHQLGFLAPDRQYFAETQQYVRIPDFLTTRSFLRMVGRYETLDRAKSFLRMLNSRRGPSDQLIFFSYTSRHLGTPDNQNSFVRLLIVVPANEAAGEPDRWVQFGIPDPAAKRHIRNLSVVSAVPGTDRTSSVYFKDYFRSYRRDGSIGITGRSELGYGDDNCVSCHKSGILPIFPEEGSVSKSEQQAVSAVNQRFLTYGTASFEKYLDPARFGPGLASATIEDRVRRFGQSFSGTTVARAMICTTCHRPQGLGSLNWPMNKILISSYIEGGQMPLGNQLKESERTELLDKLEEEYFATSDANPGILKSWLLGRPASPTLADGLRIRPLRSHAAAVPKAMDAVPFGFDLLTGDWNHAR